MAKTDIEWNANLLRFTGFLPEATTMDLQGWWNRALGAAPAEIRQTPANRATTLHGETSLERSGAADLRLVHKDERIDWYLTAHEQRIGSFVSFADYRQAADDFVSWLSPWFDSSSCPAFHRIAFSGCLLKEVPDRKTGYELIAKALPSIQLDVENSRDFQYGINRPRLAVKGFEGVPINRISKWAVLHAMLVAGSARGETFACRVDLDINTDKDVEDARFKPGQLANQVAALAVLAIEIADEGDVP